MSTVMSCPSPKAIRKPIARWRKRHPKCSATMARRASSRRGATMRSEEHTSELQSLMRISYAVFCLKKKKHYKKNDKQGTKSRDQTAIQTKNTRVTHNNITT